MEPLSNLYITTHIGFQQLYLFPQHMVMRFIIRLAQGRDLVAVEM